MINKNITEFKVDYFYKFVKTKENCNTEFNHNSEMDFILENKWFGCLRVIDKYCAEFKGYGESWMWALQDFIECEHNPDEFFQKDCWYKAKEGKRSNGTYGVDGMDFFYDGKYHQVEEKYNSHIIRFEDGRRWFWFAFDEDPNDFYVKSSTNPDLIYYTYKLNTESPLIDFSFLDLLQKQSILEGLSHPYGHIDKLIIDPIIDFPYINPDKRNTERYTINYAAGTLSTTFDPSLIPSAFSYKNHNDLKDEFIELKTADTLSEQTTSFFEEDDVINLKTKE